MTAATPCIDPRGNPIPLPGTLPPTHKVTPRDYQGWMYQAIAGGIRNYIGPFFVEASVGAGKTITMGMVLSRIQQTKAKALVLARAGELCEQNADAFWDCGAKNSIYSASLGMKRNPVYPVCVGTEGTIVNALFSDDEFWKDYAPDYLLIDECLTGDSMISTEKGLMRIDSQEIKNTRIACVNEETGEVSFDYPVRVFSNGIRNVSRITLSDGRTLECTNTHKLYSKGSWIRAGTLRTGMSITVSASQDCFMKKLIRASAAVVKRLFQKQ